MRVVVIARDATDYARSVQMFLDDFARQTGRSLEVLDPDSGEGESFCRAYDIVQYPTVIALSESGHMQNIWAGPELPTINEVSYYVSQN